jgi:hypothetical protein
MSNRDAGGVLLLEDGETKGEGLMVEKFNGLMD